MRGPWRGIHLYQMYELFGIPSHSWLGCLPFQTTADAEELVEIRRYVGQRRHTR